MHHFLSVFCLCFFLLGISLHLVASPSGGNIILGKGEISTSIPNETQIVVSEQAIIEWDNFSIGREEKVQFIQPCSCSAVLNRVVSGNPSALLGELSANGKVFLINPNGILIGNEGRIEANSFLASTFDLPNDHFLSDQYTFVETPEKFGKISNFGQIHAWGEDLLLIAPSIHNEGYLYAGCGEVVLLSGKNLDSDSLKIQVLGDGYWIDAERAIFNSGHILASEVAIHVDSNPYQYAIRLEGTLEALSLSEEGGRVCLKNGNGAIEIAGKICAKGGIASESSIDILGKIIKCESGGFISSGTLQDFGNGGAVRLIGDESLNFKGVIEVQGGKLGGEGGYVEISSPHLNYAGRVNTSAPNGKTGTLYIDPTDIIIHSGADMDILFDSKCFKGFSNEATLNSQDLIATLGMTHVTVATASSASGNGDISILAPLIYNSQYTFKLIADRDIQISDRVVNTGEGNIEILTGRDLNIGKPLSNQITPSEIGTDLGNLFLTIGRDLNIRGGSALDAYARLGSDAAKVVSQITIEKVGGNINLKGGKGANAFALLGHGGLNSLAGKKNGDIICRSVMGNLAILGGQEGVPNAFAQIGHTGSSSGNGDVSGLILFDNILGSITLEGGIGNQCYAFLGFGGIETTDSNRYSGKINLSTQNTISIKSGIGNQNFGGMGFNLSSSSNKNSFAYSQFFHLHSAGGITCESSSGNDAFIGGNGKISGDGTADLKLHLLTIASNGPISIVGGEGGDNKAFLGVYSNSGISEAAMTINSGADLTLRSGEIGTGFSAALITSGESDSKTATVSVFSMGNINLAAGTGDALIKSKGGGVIRAFNKDITLLSSQNGKACITLAGNGYIETYGDLFLNGSTLQQAIVSTTDGALRVFSKGSLNLNPNGVILNESKRSQILLVQVDGDFNVRGNKGAFPIFLNKSDGDIYLTVLRDMNILGSIQNSGKGSFHVFVGRDFTVGGTESVESSSFGTISGNIEFGIGRNLNLLGGSGKDSYAMIGGQGENIFGNIDIRFIEGDLNIFAGSGERAFAQIGHRSPNPISGNPSVCEPKGSLNIIPGTDDEQYAKIGNETGAIIK